MNGKALWSRRVWERRDSIGSLLWFLALPASLSYSLAVGARNLLYNGGCLPTKRLPRAVVSVGNITVGGTGKTPTSAWLAQELAHRGYRVAILTRGYRRAKRNTVILEPDTAGVYPASKREIDAVGDEAWMMAKLFGHKVAVGRSRYEAGSRLLEATEVDIFILDDGFQHRQLRRDVDLVLLGEDDGGWMLPAGPFREPKSAIGRADLILVTSAKEKWEGVLEERRRRSVVFFASPQPECLRSWENGRWHERPLSVLAGTKVLAVCGIAKPDFFYRMISDWQAEIVEVVEFEDHHAYSQKDWQRINRSARKAELIVTTEKDIIKLMHFPFAKGRLLGLRVAMAIERGNALVDAVERLVRDRTGGHRVG
ncbi:MAG: tetraacyldisaccharide 4'-kinase [Candidatus Binatia bacterium]